MKLSNKHLLIFVIVVGAILRLYNFWNIPFTHDEFSAIFRAGHWNFFELIEKGVKTDTHPAGVQIFMNYWILFFGLKEWAVKLPFILSGFASIWLVFKIGKMWFNETVGLLSASFFASVQFTIMYAQMARPYGSGVFLCLVAVLYWSKVILESDVKLTRNLVLFSIFGTFCAYNHHFSLLFIAILGLIGLLLVQAKTLWKYILAGIGIFVLYIPHLGVFFHQLNTGGVGGEGGWLGPPTNDFILNFLNYIVHYSWWVIFILVTVFVLGWFKKSKDKKHREYSVLFFSLFTIPFLIGFFYSKSSPENAILQFSLLIFGFPFLLLSFFGHFKNLSAKWNGILIALIMISSVSTLIFKRHHYSIFYTSFYEEFFIEMDKQSELHPNIISVINTDERMTDFVRKKHKIKSSYHKFNDFENLGKFKQFLKYQSEEKDNLYFATYTNHPNEIVPLIQEFYPFVKTKHYANGSSYLFSKKGKLANGYTISSQNFDGKQTENWINLNSKLDSTIEYGPMFQTKIHKMLTHENNWIDVYCRVESNNPSSENLILCSTIEKNGELINWSGKNIKDFEIQPSSKKTVYLSIRLADIDFDLINDEEVDLKIQVWNQGLENYELKNITIKLRQGNPIVYSWFEPITPFRFPKK